MFSPLISMKLCNVYFGKVSKQNILQVNASYLANINIQYILRQFLWRRYWCVQQAFSNIRVIGHFHLRHYSLRLISQVLFAFLSFFVLHFLLRVLFSSSIMFFTLEGLFLLFSWLFFFLSGVLVTFSVLVVFFLNFCFFFFVLKRFCFGGRRRVFNLQLHF